VGCGNCRQGRGFSHAKATPQKFNRLSRVHQRHRQQTEARRQVAIVNASSRSLKIR